MVCGHVGWFRTKGVDGQSKIDPGITHTGTSLCVQNYDSSKYLPGALNSHVIAYARCIHGPAASETPNKIRPSPNIPSTPAKSPSASPTSSPKEPSSPAKSPPPPGEPHLLSSCHGSHCLGPSAHVSLTQSSKSSASPLITYNCNAISCLISHIAHRCVKGWSLT
jgi:hypothetical protein